MAMMDKMTAPASTYKIITTIGDQETTITVIDMTMELASSSKATIDNTGTETSTTAENTMAP